MLDLTDQPYQFFPPKRSRLVTSFAARLNRFMLRHDPNLNLKEIIVQGETKSIQKLAQKGDRLVFMPNHSSPTDPQLVAESLVSLGLTPSFIAAYDVFLESKLRAWFMQRIGAFSIDRDGTDRKSLTTAVDILKKGDHGLTIFPEGNIFRLNDRVTSFLDGPAFIATKAQKALKDSAAVWLVPVSVKYSYLEDICGPASLHLQNIAETTGFPNDLAALPSPKSVTKLSLYLISEKLRQETRINAHFEDDLSPEALQQRLHEIACELTGTLEDELQIVKNENLSILERVRKIRGKVHQLRTQKPLSTAIKNSHESITTRTLLAFRILPYLSPYLSEKPTMDRYGETVDRLREDVFSKTFRPLGARKGMVHFGEPVSVSSILNQGIKSKLAIPMLTKEVEQRVAAGLSQLNLHNKAIGGQLL